MHQAADLEAHRGVLTAHCYRMLGSVVDADDAVQETMVRAWRALERFDGRSSLRTWLTRIATNVCLDQLAAGRRRARPIEDGPAGTSEDPLVARERSHWIEPIADAVIVGHEADPARRAVLRQSVRLAFVAALQQLPPKQRAALLLADVLEWSAVEVAATLELSVASVNSALQRARATLATRGVGADDVPSALPEHEADLVHRFVDAFERYDVDALAALCREDVAFSMPPFALWLEGPATVREWLRGRGAACRGSLVERLDVNGGPGYAQYKRREDGPGYTAWGIGTLELEGRRIVRWTTFLDVETLFPRFGLPLERAA